MQAQLFISGFVAALSFAPIALAGGPDNPDQVPRPQFSVTTGHDHNVLQLSGSTAQTVFEHLKDPEVRRWSSDFFQIKMGYGVICVAQAGLQNHSCWERFTHEGEVQNYFPHAAELMNSASWLQLNLKGPAMEQFYNKMSEDGDMHENKDGSIAYIKKRISLTCTKLVSTDGTPSFDCSQFLSAGGLPLGPGPDPMIGSGTHPVVVDVEEGVN